MTDSILKSYYNVTSSTFVPFAITEPLIEGSALELLDGETDGFAVDATHYDDSTDYAYPAYVGGPVGGTVAVKDTVTPANNLSDVPLDQSNIVQSSTSPKMVHHLESPYVRWSAHNLQIQSQTLNNTSPWTATNITVTANDTTAPDGTVTAEKIAHTANGSAIETFGAGGQITGLTAGAVCTASFYGKKSNNDYVRFVVTNSSGFTHRLQAYFNLNTGAVGSSSVPAGDFTIVGTNIEASSNGFYRCSATYYSAAQTTANIQIETSTTDGGGSVIGSEMWVWGVQFNRGYTPTPYLVTTTAARQGIPQSYDATTASYAILVEPAATNLALRSDDFTNASWTKSNMSTAKTATGPDNGSNSASTLTATSANATALQAITSAASERITSTWIKRRTGSGTVELTQDNGGTWTAVTVTGDWTRVEIPAVSSTDPTVGIRIVTSGNAVDVWGFQHEARTVAVVTSTIPTVAATVTRAVDSVEGNTSTFNASATANSIWDYARCLTRTITNSGFSIEQASGTSKLVIYITSSGGSNIQCHAHCNTGGVSQSNFDLPASPFADAFKVASRYALNDFHAALNGVLATAGAPDTSGTVSATWDTFRFREVGGSPHMFFYQTRIVPRIYSNAELQSTTA